MVQTIVLPVLTMFLTVRMTMAAARASRPAAEGHRVSRGPQVSRCQQSRSHTVLQHMLNQGNSGQAAEWPQSQNSGMLCSVASYTESTYAGKDRQGAHKSPYCVLLQHQPDVGSSMNTIEGLATCKAAKARPASLCAPSSSSSCLLVTAGNYFHCFGSTQVKLAAGGSAAHLCYVAPGRSTAPLLTSGQLFTLLHKQTTASRYDWCCTAGGPTHSQHLAGSIGC